MTIPAAPLLGGLLEGRRAGAVAPALDAAPLAVLIELVRTGLARTRPELVVASGLSRKIVSQRVEQAIALGLLEEGELAPSGGGRQARTLRFRAQSGHVLVATLGASEFTAAIADLEGTIIRSSHEDWDVAHGPEETMQRIRSHFAALAAQEGAAHPWAVCVGVPGPVDFTTGRLVSPPIMPGWHGFSVRAWIRDIYDAPVWVDNDVNLMALGEWARGRAVTGADALFVKIGTGVGAAFISRGRLIRGQRGAAGDIGHTHVTDDPRAQCRCGKTGCLEAVASGWRLLADLTARADESAVISAAIARRGRVVLGDVAEAVAAGDRLVMELVDDAARTIGGVVANLVNFANPGEVVIGGGVLRMGDRIVRIVEEVIRERAAELVVEGLVVRGSTLDQREGVTGAALLATESLLTPANLALWVEEARPHAHAAEVQRIAAVFG